MPAEPIAIFVWQQPPGGEEGVLWAIGSPDAKPATSPTLGRAFGDAVRSIGEVPATIHWRGFDKPW